MPKVDVSLFLSASRPQWWKRMYQSLVGNNCSYEIVCVGPKPPNFGFIKNFIYYNCNYKPNQCYAIASHLCRGELIGYSADDAVYNSYSLDKIWEAYQKYGKKTILAQSTIENGKDVTDEHYFFRHDTTTPRMAPMAFMNREWFWELGGIDRNFICGQYEQDLLMRAYQDGGSLINVRDSKVYLNHEETHGGIINKIKYKLGKNSFRSGYWSDRRFLEECWVKDGKISDKRLLPLHPFDYSNILTVAQGPSGRWGNT